MKEAMYYEKQADQKIKCHLCHFECRVKEGQVARCLGRENKKGIFYATNYGQTTSCAMDPIEKKPLFHFYPTSRILSIAANSCNLKCIFCQNWTISQVKAQTKEISPSEIVETAIRYRSVGVAYTYSEPLMWYEFVLDTAKLVRDAGLKNVLVTNGSINELPLKKLLPFIDALNVDLKGMNEHFYKKTCKSLLKPVLNTIRIANEMKTPLLEITNLIIPTLNDSDNDLDQLIDWIADLNPDIPLHFSAYHPDHRLDIPSTQLSTLKRAYNKAAKKLHYVYLGNVLLEEGSNTYCPNCHETLIIRRGQFTEVLGLADNHCKNCDELINIINWHC